MTHKKFDKQFHRIFFKEGSGHICIVFQIQILFLCCAPFKMFNPVDLLIYLILNLYCRVYAPMHLYACLLSSYYCSYISSDQIFAFKIQLIICY